MAVPGAGSAHFVYQRGQDDESDTWDDSVLIKAYDEAVSAMKAKIAESNPEYQPKTPNKSKKKRKGKGKQKKKTKENHNTDLKWKPGDQCRAVYTEDGEEYEATVVTIDEEEGTCIVQYTDYGNEEEQDLENLMPPEALNSSQEQLTETASEAENIPKNTSIQGASAGKQQKSRAASSIKPSQKRQRQQHQQQTFPPWGASAAQGPLHPSYAFGVMPPPPPPPSNFPPFQVPSFQGSGPSMPVPPVFPNIPPPPPPLPERGSGDENEALYSMLISWYMSGYHTGYYQGLKHSTSAHGAQR